MLKGIEKVLVPGTTEGVIAIVEREEHQKPPFHIETINDRPKEHVYYVAVTVKVFITSGQSMYVSFSPDDILAIAKVLNEQDK